MPTRLYFSSDRRPPVGVTPAFSGVGAWGVASGTFDATRFMMGPFKDGVTPTIGTTIDLSGTAGARALDRQYISPGLMGAQTISGRVSGQLMVREFATTDNVDRVVLNIKLVSNDGTTLRGALLHQGIYGPTLEFINNANCRNKTIISGTAVVNTNTLNAEDGDRVVIEIGYQISTAGTTPQAAALWGGGAFSSPDLPVNETSTTTQPGWLDFRDVNLKFRTANVSPIAEDDIAEY